MVNEFEQGWKNLLKIPVVKLRNPIKSFELQSPVTVEIDEVQGRVVRRPAGSVE